MSKIENIILDYGNRMLDVANGKENPTLGELNGKPVQEIKDLILELIGEKPYFDDEDAYADEKRGMHTLIDELRKKVEEL